MSFQDVADVIRFSKSGGIDKLVLICLANYTDENHQCWPSVKTLTTDSGVSERTIQRSVQSLIELGELTKVERHRENGSDTSNAYRVSVCHPSRCQADTPPVSERHPQILSLESSSSLSSKDKKRGFHVEQALKIPISDLSLASDSRFPTEWRRWLEDIFSRTKVTPGMVEEHMRKCTRFGGPDQAIEAIRNSIAHGYKSIFPPLPNTRLGQNGNGHVHGTIHTGVRGSL